MLPGMVTNASIAGAPMAPDEKPYPVGINFVGAQLIVHDPRMRSRNRPSRRVDGRGCAGFDGKFVTDFLSRLSACKLDCKPLSGEFCDRIDTQCPEYFAGFTVFISLACTNHTSTDETR